MRHPYVFNMTTLQREYISKVEDAIYKVSELVLCIPREEINSFEQVITFRKSSLGNWIIVKPCKGKLNFMLRISEIEKVYDRVNDLGKYCILYLLQEHMVPEVLDRYIIDVEHYSYLFITHLLRDGKDYTDGIRKIVHAHIKEVSQWN